MDITIICITIRDMRVFYADSYACAHVCGGRYFLTNPRLVGYISSFRCALDLNVNNNICL